MEDSKLAAVEDAYGGVIVKQEALVSDPIEFRDQLSQSIEVWRRIGKGGVWVKLPLENANLVPELVAQGFAYHHAEPEYAMLTRWLKDSPSPLPRNASHQVGVGGFVLNDAGDVLMVQELHGPLRGSGTWKMPTGLVNHGEDLHIAAPREVLEETGIRAKFEAVLTVRESHGMAFGKSDLFFVCALRAEPGQTEPKPCEVEIASAKWMPLSEFLSNPFMRGRPLYSKVWDASLCTMSAPSRPGIIMQLRILDTCEAWAKGEYKGLAGNQLEAGMNKPRQDLLLHPELATGPSGHT